jgi:hypothetical protein
VSRQHYSRHKSLVEASLASPKVDVGILRRGNRALFYVAFATRLAGGMAGSKDYSVYALWEQGGKCNVLERAYTFQEAPF